MSNTSLITFKGIDANIEVNKDDVLSIAVSRFEQDLLAQDKSLRADEERLLRERKDLQVGVEKAQKKLVSDHTQDDMESALKAVRKLGLPVKGEVRDVSYDDDKKEIKARVSIYNDGHGCYSLQAQITIPAPTKIVTDIARIAKLADDVLEIKKQRAEIRSQLANIATKERLARAELAKLTLSSTEEGKKFLDKLETQGILTIAQDD